MLTIITGRAKTGKSTYCRFAFAKKALEAGSAAYYIVPEQFTVEAEKNILSLDVMAGRALFMSEVLSFKRLVHRILGKLGGGAGNILTRQGRAMLLASVLSDMCSGGELGYYTDISRKPGEIVSLLELFDELELYNSDNASLEQKLESITGSVTGTQKVKYSDIFSIYKRFSEKVNDSFLSGSKAWETAAELSDRFGFFAGKSVWIDEFAGFTDAEFRMIACMLKEGADVTVTLCTSHMDEPVFYAIDRTLDKLKAVAVSSASGFTVKDISELLPDSLNNRANSLIKQLEQAYTNMVPKKLDTDSLNPSLLSTVSLSEAADTYNEVIAAAERIAALTEKGYRYSEIAVAVRNINDYSVYVRTVFGGKGIPFFIDDVKNINSNAAVVTVNALLDLYLFGMKPEDVIIMLKSGFFVESRDRQDEIENYIISHNLRYPSKYASSAVPELVRFYEIYTALKELFAGAAGLKQAADGFTAYLQKLEIDRLALEMSAQLDADGENEKANEFRRIWNIIIELIDLIKIYLGNEKAESAQELASQLKRYLQIGFSGLKMGFIPQEQNAVRIVGIGRSRIGAPRVTLLLGVNEGVMPAEVNDTGILRDFERDEFESAGISLADSSLSRAYKELFMIYSALFSPSDELHVSYADKDAKGGELLPSSRIIKRLTVIAPFIETGKTEAETEAVRDASDGSGDEGLNGQEGQEAQEWKEAQEGFAEEYDFNVSPELSRRLIDRGDKSVISISQVEAYNNCPMSYLLERGLGLSERDNGEFKITDLGSIMHAILEKGGMDLAHTDLSQMDARALSDLANTLTDKYFSEIVTGFYPDFDLIYSSKNKILMQKIKDASAVILKALGRQYQKSRFKALAFECDFSESGLLPSLAVKALSGPERTVLVSGKIDRLDTFCESGKLYISVVDYKSSKKQIRERDIAEGLRIQLITYIKAAAENAKARQILLSMAGSENADVTPGAGLYFVFGSGIKVVSDRTKIPENADESADDQFKMSGIVIGGDEIAEYLGGAKKGGIIKVPKAGPVSAEKFKEYSEMVDNVILSTAGSIGAGTFGPSPKPSASGERHCKYCPYYPVCGIEIVQKS